MIADNEANFCPYCRHGRVLDHAVEHSMGSDSTFLYHSTSFSLKLILSPFSISDNSDIFIDIYHSTVVYLHDLLLLVVVINYRIRGRLATCGIFGDEKLAGRVSPRVCSKCRKEPRAKQLDYSSSGAQDLAS